MKIIYLVHQFFPEYQTGTEKFVLNSAIMTQKFGYKVKVITHSSHDNGFYDHKSNGVLYNEYLFEGIPVLAFKYMQNPPHMNLVLCNALLREFSRSVLEFEQPDIVHAGHIMRVHEFIRITHEIGVPYIITLTDFFSLCPKINLTPDQFSLCSGPEQGKACSILCSEFNPTFINNRLVAAKNILSNAHTVISPSYFVKKMFEKEYPELSLKKIPHGIRYAHINKNDQKYNDKTEIIFGYIGNMIYHKGVHILVEAFSQLDNVNARLKIFGFGQKEYLDMLQQITGKDQRIAYMGHFEPEELGNIYKQIDILVNPSICYETYSFVLHEALASNVPVIGSSLGVLKEKIQNGLNGFTFHAGDANDLRRKMELIIYNPKIINDLKDNIQNKYIIPSIEQEAYEYFLIYNKIIHSNSTDKSDNGKCQ